MRFNTPSSYVVVALSVASVSTVSLIEPRTFGNLGQCANLKDKELKVLGHSYGTYIACLW